MHSCTHTRSLRETTADASFLARSRAFFARPSLTSLPDTGDGPAFIDPSNYTTDFGSQMKLYTPSALGQTTRPAVARAPSSHHNMAHAALGGVQARLQADAARRRSKEQIGAPPKTPSPVKAKRSPFKAGAAQAKPSPSAPPSKPEVPAEEEGFFGGLLGLMGASSGRSPAPEPEEVSDDDDDPTPASGAAASGAGVIHVVEELQQQVRRMGEEMMRQQRVTAVEMGKLRKENDALKMRVNLLEKSVELPHHSPELPRPAPATPAQPTASPDAPRRKAWFKS